MARQIQAGAPAHIYISANPVWSEMLEKAGHARQLVNIASNQLVLVVPKNLKRTLPYEATPAYFKQLLGSQRLAIADPQTAPAGAYARSYLKQAGIWKNVERQIAYGQNVRQVLRLAEKGGLPAFVYKSDATASESVSILFEVPAGMTDIILYQAALLKRAGAPSIAFLKYLQTIDASIIWQKHGFNKIASK
jgi:molybdate transport system substrate-binding protein